MEEKILERLDALAAKLRMGADRLWDVCVRQAIIEGWMNILSAVVLAIVAIVVGRFALKTAHEDDAPLVFLEWIVSGAAGIASGALVYGGVNYLLNPQFHAFDYISKALLR